MKNKEEILPFLLRVRTKTYAGKGGDVKPAFNGSKQLEYKEDKWFYRDVFYVGNGIFTGLEIVHYQKKPVWTMSYYGNFKGMTEEEIDSVLRKALLEKWETARTWESVKWQEKDYKYVCEPAFEGSIEEMAGTEKIMKDGEQVYFFYYAGGIII